MSAPQHTPEFSAFLARLQNVLPLPPVPAELRPQTDAARIALLKIALDQFLLLPGLEDHVGQDAWEFALNVREDC